MAGKDDIVVEGLKELQATLRKVDAALPRQLRKVNKEAADTVASDARGRAPVLSGRLRDSIAARAEQRSASVKGGGGRVPYFGFIDFGGAVGRDHATVRPFIKGGRIIYPAVTANRDRIFDTYERGINALLRDGLQN